MTTPEYDVLGIGNAIVDVIARADDDFLARHDMHKGTMALIDEERANAIYDAMGPAVEISGGSAANTIVGLASFGARAAFCGKVKQDTLGKAFAHDIRAAGVAYQTPAAGDGPAAGRPSDSCGTAAGRRPRPGTAAHRGTAGTSAWVCAGPPTARRSGRRAVRPYSPPCRSPSHQ